MRETSRKLGIANGSISVGIATVIAAIGVIGFFARSSEPRSRPFFGPVAVLIFALIFAGIIGVPGLLGLAGGLKVRKSPVTGGLLQLFAGLPVAGVCCTTGWGMYTDPAGFNPNWANLLIFCIPALWSCLFIIGGSLALLSTGQADYNEIRVAARQASATHKRARITVPALGADPLDEEIH